MFGIADLDGNRKLDYQEVLADDKTHEDFKAADADGDRFLTKEEYLAAPEAQPDFFKGQLDKAFEHSDKYEKDGKVSVKESIIAYDLEFEFQ